MGTADQSMVNNLKAFVKQSLEGSSLSTGKYINYYKGLNVKTSFGMGGFAKIPWITLRGEGQKTSDGIYVGILCFRKQGILTVTYGTSEENEASLKWNIPNDAETIIEYFKSNKIAKPERYGDCYLYKAYSIGIINYDAVVEDINALIEKYKNLLEAYSLPRDAKFIAPTPSGKGPQKETFEYNQDEIVGMKEKSNNAFSPLQKIFFGTPGGGKSHKVKCFVEEEKGAKERCFRTTFHPDTDYSSFVGAYKPVMKEDVICYKYIPQVFTQAYVAAWNDPSREYFLVIEEINRGNCAQIFGDLFQLLDRDDNGYSEYPIRADADLADFLETAKYKDGNDVLSNKKGIENGNLCLPSNLSILATMNTSDQSLFPMDSAFKRRWDWEYVPSDFKEDKNFNITIGNKTYKWHPFLRAANARIKEATDSEDKQMGAFFVKADMDEEQFKSKVMYYLWSEVCKEEYKTNNNFFRYNDKDKKEQEFTFNELYEPGSTEKIQRFMKYIFNEKNIEESEDSASAEDSDNSAETE